MKTKITIDHDRREVFANGTKKHLTPKEYAILHYLLTSGKIVSREDLLEKIWGHPKSLKIDTRTVDQHIARIRTSLGKWAIETVTNSGYKTPKQS